MRRGYTFLRGLLALLALTPLAVAQPAGLRLPEKVEAGSPFSATTAGSGPAILYIVGPGGAFERNV